MFALDGVDRQLRKDMLNLRIKLGRLPLTELLVAILPVPHNAGVLLFNERAISLFRVLLHEVVYVFNPRNVSLL